MANKPISQYDEVPELTDDAVFIISRDNKTYGVKFGALRRSIDPFCRTDYEDE